VKALKRVPYVAMSSSFYPTAVYQKVQLEGLTT